MPQRASTRDYRRIFAEAAWQIGTTRGCSALTVRSIAGHVDVSPGLIYAHFDKAALVAELVGMASHRLMHALRGVPPQDDLREHLAAIAHAYVDFAHAHAWLADHGQAELAPPCDVPEYRRVFEECVAPLLALAQHRIHVGVAESVTHLWLGVHGFAQLTAPGRSSAALGGDPILVTLHARMLLRGILRVQA